MQEEIALTHSRELKGSDDEDSPDQLSEIDRMQELMGKLSAKNKQIKRLLRDIDVRKFLLQAHVIDTQTNLMFFTHTEIRGTINNAHQRD